jgi:transglutaminase-like putative cysteine protease
MRTSLPFGLSLRALGGRLGEQWERERRDTLFLMFGTLLSALPHARHLPLWASLTFGMLFLWRLGLVLSGRWLPRDSVRWIAAIACTAGVYASYGTLIGRDSGVALLVLFLGLKLMEMQARRDLFVVLFLCFFVLLTTFFYSQGLGTALLSVAAVIVLLATLLTMQFTQGELSIARRLRWAAVILLQAAPIALALFFLFPRLESPLWGLPGEGGAGQTGLSDSMAPGNIGQLARSEQVVARVKFQGAAPAVAQMYWRGPVFGDFDGRTWRALSSPIAAPPQPRILVPENAKPTRYTVTLEPQARAMLLALEAPVSVDPLQSGLGGEVVLQHDLQMLTRQAPPGRIRYQVESQLNARFGLNETRLSRQNWLDLPPGFNPRTMAMAAEWRSKETDPARLVVMALSMLRNEAFRYTLTPPVLGKHSVDEFLFTTRAGFCEHYAGAFVVLMRALDIPSRVVTGYQGAEPNPVDDYWIVRQADAHAWAEVWLEEQGWVRIDPVTAVAPERVERGARAINGVLQADRDGALGVAARWRLNFDAVTHAWNQWVLNYDGTRQRTVLSSWGIDVRDWGQVAAVLAGVLGVLLSIAALITLHPRRIKDPVERAWREFCDRLAQAGLQRAPHETALDFFARIQPALEPSHWGQARRIVDSYNELRYCARGNEPAAVRRLQSMVRSFRP